MLPIRDTIRSRNYPVVNLMLIGLNVLVYLIQLTQGNQIGRFFILYGLVPARYSVDEISNYFTFGQQVFSLFSFMFLHGGFWHLLGNMWSLYIFGDNIEDRLGPFRYLVFYLLSGWASGLVHLLFNWHSQVPTIGASGAIAGVMGAYLLLFPRSKILTVVPIFFFPLFIEISAVYFLGIWLLIQFLSAAGTSSVGGGIAWWAHIGGFVFGLLAVKLFMQAPDLGLTNLLRRRTVRTKTPRLQVIRTSSSEGEPNLYGAITITPFEAREGTSKLVNIPWGFHERLLRITVPPGVQQGTTLRLQGLGKQSGSIRGDLFLKVEIRDGN
jgi:hypothetical protein